MAKPQVTLFHETLCRIVRARGLVGQRAEKARHAVACYVRILHRAAGLGSAAPGVDRAMIDAALLDIETKLKEWRLLGAETALVCDAALAAVRRERVENLCDRRIVDLVPQVDLLRAPGTAVLK